MRLKLQKKAAPIEVSFTNVYGKMRVNWHDKQNPEWIPKEYAIFWCLQYMYALDNGTAMAAKSNNMGCIANSCWCCTASPMEHAVGHLAGARVPTHPSERETGSCLLRPFYMAETRLSAQTKLGPTQDLPDRFHYTSRKPILHTNSSWMLLQ